MSDDSFIKDFLAHDLGKIDFSMHVVLDNPNRSCKVLQNSKQISDITYYVTREEIEAVHLYANSKWPAEYEKYLKKVKGKESKPSSFFKNECNIKNIKTYNYVYALWSDNVKGLVAALIKVKSNMKKKHPLHSSSKIQQKYLADLLKPNAESLVQ